MVIFPEVKSQNSKVKIKAAGHTKIIDKTGQKYYHIRGTLNA
jgi:hypothetical protein